MPVPNQKPLPTREELEQLYVIDDLSVNEIGRTLNLHYYKVKELLLKYLLWDDVKAERNKNYAARERAKQSKAKRLADEAAGEPGEAPAERSEALQLPIVIDRAQTTVASELEQDDSAWTRLNARQKQTALTFVRLMTQPVRATYEQIAEEAGISRDTLNQDMRDVDFQEVTTELMNRDARFLINTLMKQDLVKLLDSGKVNTRDRETVLKYLGELQADTMIQIANVLPHRSNDSKLPY